MEKYTAYTPNTDGSITVLAGSSNPDVFAKILPTGTQYEVHEGEVYQAGGKTWLSQDDEGYIEAKAAEEQEKALFSESSFRIPFEESLPTQFRKKRYISAKTEQKTRLLLEFSMAISPARKTKCALVRRFSLPSAQSF
jgi:hypothetical protein